MNIFQQYKEGKVTREEAIAHLVAFVFFDQLADIPFTSADIVPATLAIAHVFDDAVNCA